MPARQVRLRGILDSKGFEYLGIEALLVVGERHIVDRGDIERLNDGGRPYVAEQRDLAALVFGNFPVGAAQQNVGLDTDRAQLLDRVLGRFGLQFTGGRDERQQGQVQVDAIATWQVVAELADRLQERQALNVADRSADLAEHEVVAVVAVEDEFLKCISDMRDHLNRGAEIVAATFLGDDVLVEPAGGDIVLLVRGAAGETFVVAKIEIGLGPIIGYENFAMLIGRRHRTRINI